MTTAGNRKPLQRCTRDAHNATPSAAARSPFCAARGCGSRRRRPGQERRGTRDARWPLTEGWGELASAPCSVRGRHPAQSSRYPSLDAAKRIRRSRRAASGPRASEDLGTPRDSQFVGGSTHGGTKPSLPGWLASSEFPSSPVRRRYVAGWAFGLLVVDALSETAIYATSLGRVMLRSGPGPLGESRETSRRSGSHAALTLNH
jgi:hypothetical protein